MILIVINLLFTATVSCTGCSFGTAHDMPVQYREEMRAFVKKISAYAKTQNPRFVVIPQNGQTVAWNRDTPVDENGVPLTEADTSYMDAIDGCGREDTFYGEKGAGKATSSSASAYFVCTCKKLRPSFLSITVLPELRSPTRTQKTPRRALSVLPRPTETSLLFRNKADTGKSIIRTVKMETM